MDIRKQQKYQGKDYSDIKTVTVKPIGKGADGVVHLANYTVQNSSSRDDLKILTANNVPLNTTVQLAVKTLSQGVTANPEEVEIVGRLFEAHKTKKQKNESPPNFIPTVYDHTNARFISPFVSYDTSGQSSNLEDYLIGISKIDADPLPVKNTGKALTEFVIVMKNGQDAILQSGVFHNDVSTRNLIVKPFANGQYSATLTDFGQARFVSENFSCTFKDKHQVPIRYVDPDFLADQEHKVTITTHLYMRRAAILECAGNMMGLEQYKVLANEPSDTAAKTAGWVLSQAGTKDAIKNIFSHYIEHFDYLPHTHPRTAQVKEFIACFQNYLTQMPTRSPNESEANFFSRAQEEDDLLFLAACKNAYRAGFISENAYNKLSQEHESKGMNALVERIVSNLHADYSKAHPSINFKIGSIHTGKHTTDLEKLESSIIKARMESSSNAEAKNKVTEALMDYCSDYMRKHKYQVDSLSEMAKRVNDEPHKHSFLRSVLIQLQSLDTRPELKNLSIAPQIKKDSTFTKFFKPKRDSSDTEQPPKPTNKKGQNLS